MGKIIGAFVLLVIGGFMIVCTNAMVHFQTWSQRAIMGAQYIPSQRTYTAIRIIGVFLIILGIIVGTRIFK